MIKVFQELGQTELQLASILNERKNLLALRRTINRKTRPVILALIAMATPGNRVEAPNKKPFFRVKIADLSRTIGAKSHNDSRLRLMNCLVTLFNPDFSLETYMAATSEPPRPKTIPFLITKKKKKLLNSARIEDNGSGLIIVRTAIFEKLVLPPKCGHYVEYAFSQSVEKLLARASWLIGERDISLLCRFANSPISDLHWLTMFNVSSQIQRCEQSLSVEIISNGLTIKRPSRLKRDFGKYLRLLEKYGVIEGLDENGRNQNGETVYRWTRAKALSPEGQKHVVTGTKT